MDKVTADLILDINRQFYQTHARSFSATRHRVQPGVRKMVEVCILNNATKPERILDLGCGNGELARHLARVGYRGSYLGLDFSSNLLSDAATFPLIPGYTPSFARVDLTQPGWSKQYSGHKYDLITCFAVLHHIPGFELREMILREAASLAGSTARLVISNWQFLNSERLTRHLVDWDSVGISSSCVDERDALLDWRAEETPAKSAGKPSVRYAHQFSLEELDELALRSGWSVECSDYSDGKEGNLGLYQIWRIVT